MKRWITILVAGLLGYGVRPATADDRIRIGIVTGVAVNLEASRVDALGQDLAEALARELDVDAVGGLEVRRKLPADGLPDDCVATPACVADVARRLDANQLLFLVMVDTGGAVQIDSTWIEPATDRRVSRPAIDIAVLGEAKARFASSATQLLPDAPLRLKPRPGGIDGTMTRRVPRHLTTASYITAGVAVVGLGLGLGFGIKTKSLYQDCDKPMAPCSDGQQDTIRRDALIADLAFVAAVGGATATAILYWTSGAESRLVVSPSVEGRGATITAIGKF